MLFGLFCSILGIFYKHWDAQLALMLHTCLFVVCQSWLLNFSIHCHHFWDFSEKAVLLLGEPKEIHKPNFISIYAKRSGSQDEIDLWLQLFLPVERYEQAGLHVWLKEVFRGQISTAKHRLLGSLSSEMRSKVTSKATDSLRGHLQRTSHHLTGRISEISQPSIAPSLLHSLVVRRCRWRAL